VADKGYVWFSSGSDVTGVALAEALKFDSGKKTPDFSKYAVVIGWGCKPGEKYSKEVVDGLVSAGKLRLVNHPEDVVISRDKLAFYKSLAKAGAKVPAFIEKGSLEFNAFKAQILAALRNSTLRTPILGSDRFNKVGPHFCYTAEDVEALFASPASIKDVDYFRAYVPGDEFRIHVFRDLFLVVQKKVLAKDPVATTATALREKATKVAEKDGKPFTSSKADMDRLSVVFAQEMLRAPSHVLRSVGRGWDFEDQDLEKVPEELMLLAGKALETARLDMGVVSISLDPSGPTITNITTAPALTANHLIAYTAAVTEFMEAGKKVAVRRFKSDKSAAATTAAARPTEQEVKASLQLKLSNMSPEKLEKLRALVDKL